MNRREDDDPSSICRIAVGIRLDAGCCPEIRWNRIGSEVSRETLHIVTKKGRIVTTLTIQMPDKVFSAMRSSPEEFAGELRLSAAVAWYEQGRVSMEIAACIAGLDRTDFLLALARMGKNSFQVDLADLDEELARG